MPSAAIADLFYFDQPFLNTNRFFAVALPVLVDIASGSFFRHRARATISQDNEQARTSTMPIQPAFQLPTPIDAVRPSGSGSTIALCQQAHGLRSILRATATFPTKPTTKPSHASPPTPAAPSAVRHLNAYETFLRNSPTPLADVPETRGGAERATDAPVFRTAEGGLVCQWDADMATGHREQQDVERVLADYESFLASAEAGAVDLCKPVYMTNEGCLVCPYP